MRSKRWALIASLAGIVSLLGAATPASALPSLAGYTGLIKIPTTEVLQNGELCVGFSWIGGSRSYLFPPQTNRMYYASLGLLPGLEVSLDMLQVVGWIDSEAPGVAYAFHRLSNVKYQLPLPACWPEVAIGAQDPLSANGIARGPVGQTRYGLTTLYAVVSQSMGPLELQLGYGDSANFIRGVYFGADAELALGIHLRAEHDSQEWNLGAYWQPVPWFGVYGAKLFPDDWAYGTALTWRL